MQRKEKICELKKKSHPVESLFLSLFILVLQEQRVYISRAILFYSSTRSSPYSYRQPFGRGQLLSRRYCKHSVWLFTCAFRTASWSHGALAVSRKYFKQSKWPFAAACQHATSLYLSIYTQQDIRVYEDDHFEPPNRQYSNTKALSLLRVSI